MFTITDGVNPIEGANVQLGSNGTVTTNADGIAVFAKVLPANDIAYTVSSTKYDDISGTVSVIDSDISKELTLNLTTYNVTFTINSGTDAVADAIVSLNGYGTATSDASGIATFTNVALANNIAYTVSAPNYDDVSGTVSVVDGDVSADVNLISTGFNDLVDSKIKVYPNPVVDMVTITQATEDKIINIELYNHSGQKVYLKSFVKNQKRIELNIQDLKQGTYILRLLTQNNNMFSKRIFKK